MPVEYIGVKRVNATPMNRQAYNELRGWAVPVDENPSDPGYLVEYLDGGQPNHGEYAGYISWSPKEIFEDCYRVNGGLNFGDALEALKLGHRVARCGWNGKGMWLTLSCPVSRKVPYNQFWSVQNAIYAKELGGEATVLPCITMKTATGEILMGWLASQSDMLASDWCVLN